MENETLLVCVRPQRIVFKAMTPELPSHVTEKVRGYRLESEHSDPRKNNCREVSRVVFRRRRCEVGTCVYFNGLNTMSVYISL